ncbi:hypothetical protein [Actinopolymorpha pittospori]|uniref:Homeodomain-like domain-containing protein n=1 Tax=Actinopolymorpha pittospori TaxID=648752 RepID=A0A927RAH2_9ACTN|nr:hypothetical protein [Actinopolymorpha pittospori]MBE1608987.1 hypothetical protein [Actinopolymorpha pittospori]
MPEPRTADELATISAKLRDIKSAGDRADAAQRAAAQRQADLAEAVRQARLAGSSWSEVGLALGMTRQAAFKRWREIEGSDA